MNLVVVTVPLLMIVVGLVCLVRPDIVRRFDTRMTRFIADEDEYLFTLRIFGIVFTVFSLLVGILVGIFHFSNS